MVSTIDRELWSSPALLEASVKVLNNYAESIAARRSGSSFRFKTSPSSTPLFLIRRPRERTSPPSTVAFAEEVLSEAPETSYFEEQDEVEARRRRERSNGNVYDQGNEDQIEVADRYMPETSYFEEQDEVEVCRGRERSNGNVYDQGNEDQIEAADCRMPEWPLPFTEKLHAQGEKEEILQADDVQDAVSNTAQKIHLRLDALDMQRDFRGRLRPPLDVDSPPVASRSKPGKRQNVPRKARKIIMTLRDLPVEDFAPALKQFKSINPDRADWLYVVRYFKEKEDKSMLLEVFIFVLVLPTFKATARDYTNLIRVFVQLGNPEAVESSLKLMADRGIFPDLMTFTVVIGMYGKLGNLDMVKRKVEEMKLHQLEPDTITYCAIIEAYCKVGHAPEAELLMEKMELEDLPLKSQIFISLIKGYGNIGRVEDAERVFQLMQVKLLYPDRRSYSALMDAYSKDEDVRHAIEVFNNMVSVGIEPTDKSLARLLLACEKKNMLPEAMEIMEKLETKKFKYGTNMLISLKGWLSKLELHKEVEQMSFEVEKRLERKGYAARKWSTKAYLPASYGL